MPLTADQKAWIRKVIAREAKVEIDGLTPETRLTTDLGMEPEDVRTVLNEIDGRLGIGCWPLLDEVNGVFLVTKRRTLTKASREKIEQLLPGAPLPASKLESIEDLLSLAVIETLFEQKLARNMLASKAVTMSSKSQQAWKKRLPKELGERRLRLFLAAAARHAFYEKRLVTPAVEEAFALLLRYADTGESKKELRNFRRDYRDDWYGTGVMFHTSEYIGHAPYRSLYDALDPNKPEEAVEAIAVAFRGGFQLQRWEVVPLLRCFYDDLISPLGKKDKFDDAWRTTRVVKLATTMYKSRDFGKMKHLATALEKAGCKNQAILDHCRSKEVFHNRGCWVVDAILDGNWPGAEKPKELTEKPKELTEKPKELTEKPKELTEKPKEPAEKTLLASLPKKLRLSIEEILQNEDKALTIQKRLALLWDFTKSMKRSGLTQKDINTRIKHWGEMCPALTKEGARTAVALDNVADNNWTELGLALRFAREQPSELALAYGIMQRSMWLQNALMSAIGCGERVFPWYICMSLAVRDVTLARRIADRSPEIKMIRREDPMGAVCLALFRRDLDSVRSLARSLGRVQLRDEVEWIVPCVQGVAKGSSRLVAESFQDRIDTTRKRRSSVHNAVDLDAHGFYHLCQWAAPDSVAEFDVTQKLPWDAELHTWLQENEDPVSQLNLRAVSRDLHRVLVLLEPPKGL